jgi:hypothetical protein
VSRHSGGILVANHRPTPMTNMSGRIIEEQYCPRCSILRTVRLSAERDCFCLHCGFRWPAAPAPAEHPEQLLELRLVEQFTPQEQERLRTYRAAVRAGFYRDW